MNIQDLLPIGSVVLLKDGEKRLMIIGIKQMDAESGDSGKEYDYLGVLYPEGYVGAQFQYLFDHENIEEVVFKGYEDRERKLFLKKLLAIYKQKK